MVGGSKMIKCGFQGNTIFSECNKIIVKPFQGRGWVGVQLVNAWIRHWNYLRIINYNTNTLNSASGDNKVCKWSSLCRGFDVACFCIFFKFLFQNFKKIFRSIPEIKNSLHVLFAYVMYLQSAF